MFIFFFFFFIHFFFKSAVYHSLLSKFIKNLHNICWSGLFFQRICNMTFFSYKWNSNVLVGREYIYICLIFGQTCQTHNDNKKCESNWFPNFSPLFYLGLKICSFCNQMMSRSTLIFSAYPKDFFYHFWTKTIKVRLITRL